MNWQEHIERNPQILCGKPVIKGTRLSVEFILERLGQGAPVEDLLKAHPQLKPEHVLAAQAYAAAYLAFDKIVWLGEQAV